MDPVQSQTPKKSRRLLVIGIIAVVVLVAVVAAVSLLVANNTKKQTATTTSPTPSVQVATKDQVKQNLSDLDASIKQAQADQAAAKQAIQASQNQVKISE